MADGRPDRSEWRYVMDQVALGRVPSDDHLRRLWALYGLPEYAEEYVRSRIGHGPGFRPMPEPDDWGYFGEFSAQQAGALMDLNHLHAELAEYETDERGPRFDKRWQRTIATECLSPSDPDSPEDASVDVRLVWVASRSVWRVEGPKDQARRIVAARYSVSESTLKEWEKQLRDTPHPLGEAF